MDYEASLKATKITPETLIDLTKKPKPASFFEKFDKELFFESDFETTSLYYSTNPDYECSAQEPFVMKEICKENLFSDL